LKLPNNQELLLVLEEVNTNYERGYETKGSGYSREKSRRVPRSYKDDHRPTKDF
jgi:hypothetical protein